MSHKETSKIQKIYQ